MIVACCSGVRSLMLTSEYTPCFFICSTSCFIPSIVFFLSSPSVLWTIGSSRILSNSTSCSSSQVVVVIVSPLFVVTFIALILILVAGGSTCSGRCIGCCCSVVLCCFGSLPCVISSDWSLFGIGSGCLLVGLVGAVAIGRSTIVWCWCDVLVCCCCAVLASVVCVCCCVVSTAVCVSVVACCAALVVFAGIIIAGCNASVGVTGVHGGALMMSINCLSYFSGSTCRLIVLVLMILPAMPTIDSLVIVSFPNQIPL